MNVKADTQLLLSLLLFDKDQFLLRVKYMECWHKTEAAVERLQMFRGLSKLPFL